MAVTAYWLINTTFMFYDDEGYVLQTLRSYLAGGRLYDEIFSQYGPWPYVYHQLIGTILQHPLTHMMGRSITLCHWVAAALLAGLLTQRLTGQITWAVACTLTVFGLLWQMTSEPSHPGSMISMLVALAVLLGARLGDGPRPLLAAGGLGALIAMLLLTKINVGLLMLAGAGCAALRYTAWPARWQAPAEVVAVAGLLSVPWGLMGKKLDDPWVLTLAIHFTAASAGLLWVTPNSWTGRLLPARLWLATGLAAIFTGSLVCIAVWNHGTSFGALAEAVLISPLKQPANFTFGFTWLPMVWPLAAGAWLLTGFAGWQIRWRHAISPTVRQLLILVRLATLLLFVSQVYAWVTIQGVGRFIVFCLPLLPLFIVPLETTRADRPRMLAVWCAALLAMPQVLHAFPVAGSQMGWGTFMLVPLFLTGLFEAATALALDWSSRMRWAPRVVGLGLLAINAYQAGLLVKNGWMRYHTSRPLDLPGAEDIRLDGPSRLALRTLTLNASIHTDVLFSQPGMFSYNIWSGAPPPTPRNATHWFWLLDKETQGLISARLAATPRRAVITNQPLDEFLVKINVPTAGPLREHIASNYQPLFTIPDFTFLVPRGSHAVAFGMMERFEKLTGAATDPDHLMLHANLALSGIPATVRVESIHHPWPVLLDYSRVNFRMYIEPINSAGQTLGAAIPLPARAPVRGLYRLTLLGPQPAHEPGRGAVLIVADPNGRVLAEAIF
jgi:hypothetical protein